MKDANKVKGQVLGMPLERPRGNAEAGHRKLKLMCYDLCVLGFVTVMVLRVFPRGSVTLSLGGGWHAVCIGGRVPHGLAVRVQCLLPGVAVQPDQQLPCAFWLRMWWEVWPMCL